MSLEQKRILKTAIPGPKSAELQSRRTEVVSSGVGTMLPVFIERAHDAILEDVDGNQLIDFGTGIGVVTIGHTNQGVVDAVQEQVSKLTHTLFTVAGYEKYVRAAELLTKHAPGDFKKKAAFFTSGAEAVENAVKIARRATGRHEIAVFDHAYHGRTNLTMAMNFKAHPYATGFGALPGGVHHAPMSYPFRDPEGMTGEQAAMRAITYLEKRVGASQLAAVMIEPVQGEGGFIVPAPGFLTTLRKWCTDNGIVMVADEVQSGMARTGKWFACQWEEGFEPDLITVAKGIAGGMPVSGVVGRAEIMDSPHAGGLGGTFGGSPTAVAAAVAVMEQFESGPWMDRALEIGGIITERLSAMQKLFPVIGDIRGIGAMQAFELVEPGTMNPNQKATDALMKFCHQNGVVVLNAGTYSNVLRLLPPLAITDELLHDALDVISDGLATL
ncbi:MAG: 4-aminobutyrate--2-oxoglutarate transaminase [Micrococcales bacterium]|nr:4-aminobutyrate--2-oxoglutarate transaminase [Micrococcales bacterium]MBT5397721.1 4-aminobutyrate--2-oxoglutarate transaminase [Micrococcales bacterium]MBT5431561.1 4-aminobutyrate--2-oxoglutarate transaminase [Micrococcales bacterium]MBT7925717.1 4-aminobutyrate--2-oxoglutarate transaminase [Micrococcales bacterium]